MGVLKVAYIGVRECFVKASASIIDNIKSSLESALSMVSISHKTKVNVFSDINKYITVEILAPNVANIKSIDLKTISTLIEVFEEECINHFFESLEINLDIPSKKKAQRLDKIEIKLFNENIEQKNASQKLSLRTSDWRKDYGMLKKRSSISNLLIKSKVQFAHSMRRKNRNLTSP